MVQQVDQIMSLAEIQQATIQAEVAKEAFTQVEKRLSDLIETKKSFETRAQALLTGYTTLALAVIGAGGSFFTSAPLVGHAPSLMPVAFFAAGIPLLIAVYCMVWALQPASYGNLGSSPHIWLKPGVINAPENVVPTVQAFLVYFMAERITATEAANTLRATLIAQGSRYALASPIMLFVGVFVALGLGRLTG